LSNVILGSALVSGTNLGQWHETLGVVGGGYDFTAGIFQTQEPQARLSTTMV
jgi:hypothetical protein